MLLYYLALGVFRPKVIHIHQVFSIDVLKTALFFSRLPGYLNGGAPSFWKVGKLQIPLRNLNNRMLTIPEEYSIKKQGQEWLHSRIVRFFCDCLMENGLKVNKVILFGSQARKAYKRC